MVSVTAAVAAGLIDRVQIVLARRRLPYFYLQVAGGAIATLLAGAVAATPIEVDPSLVVTANIILLLAGIGLMGAVQDALTGFYLTSSARLIEAMMATAGIIAGVALGISVADGIGLELGQLVPGALGVSELPAVARRCGGVGGRLQHRVVRPAACGRADRPHHRLSRR